MVLDLLTKYYGVDILAMILTLIGLYYIGSKKRHGFIIALLGNILWVILGTMTSAVGLIVANTAIIFLYIRGYVKWGKQ